MRPEDLQGLARVLPSVRIKGACARGKRIMPNLAAAEREAARMNEQGLRRGPNVPSQPFRCRLCGGWHIGRPRR